MSPSRKVIAYHLILTCYGFWLPNDPRGSGSSQVWADTLKPFGPAKKVTSQRSVAAKTHDRNLRLAAKRKLKYPPVRLNGLQARAVARGFGRYLAESSIRCLACSVMPDHAHLVLIRPVRLIEKVAIDLKSASVHALLEANLHPFQHHPADDRPKVWARGDRHIFLFDDAGIARSIGYVESNPVNWGFRPQRWSFVRPKR